MQLDVSRRGAIGVLAAAALVTLPDTAITSFSIDEPLIDEIRDNVTRMRREWEAQRGALATVRRFNATLSAKGYSFSDQDCSRANFKTSLVDYRRPSTTARGGLQRTKREATRPGGIYSCRPS
jgi:hypothetical protein